MLLLCKHEIFLKEADFIVFISVKTIGKTACLHTYINYISYSCELCNNTDSILLKLIKKH